MAYTFVLVKTLKLDRYCCFKANPPMHHSDFNPMISRGNKMHCLTTSDQLFSPSNSVTEPFCQCKKEAESPADLLKSIFNIILFPLCPPKSFSSYLKINTESFSKLLAVLSTFCWIPVYFCYSIHKNEAAGSTPSKIYHQFI